MIHLHQIFNSIWMINSDYAANYLPLVAAYLKNEPIVATASGTIPRPTFPNSVNSTNAFYISQYEGQTPEEAPESSIAYLSLNGMLTKHAQLCGPAGMITKANLMERCFANPNVKGIILATDSGGGQAQAMRLFNETLAKKNKPVVGYIDDYCASAAYGCIAGCDYIVANSHLAQIGSIGTYTTVADHTRYFEKQGIDITQVYAKESTDKNQTFLQAIKGNIEPLQQVVNTFNDYFIDHVQTHRAGKLSDRKEWATGKMFFSPEALRHGLIDQVDTLENVFNYFLK